MRPLSLPWPAAVLSPNSRVHRMVKARAVKRYRNDCGFAALEAGWRRGAVESLDLRVTIHPPRRPGLMNVDNIIAALKPGVDGLADVLGIDDSRFRIAWPTEFAEQVKGGAVRVEVA